MNRGAPAQRVAGGEKPAVHSLNFYDIMARVAERWLSGRKRLTRNQVRGLLLREFKSLPLRQIQKQNLPPAADRRLFYAERSKMVCWSVRLNKTGSEKPFINKAWGTLPHIGHRDERARGL